MPHPVEIFVRALEGVSSQSVYWIGKEWGGQLLPALRQNGWKIDQPEAAARLEFLSLTRESRDGILIEDLPPEWNGELVQRLLGAFFQGLRPGGVLFMAFRAREMVALLAWLRQAGFEPVQQGVAGEINGVLVRKIGSAARES